MKDMEYTCRIRSPNSKSLDIREFDERQTRFCYNKKKTTIDKRNVILIFAAL